MNNEVLITSNRFGVLISISSEILDLLGLEDPVGLDDC